MSKIVTERIPMAISNQSDSEFVDSLRAAIDAYFAAVDAWEAEFRKYYRMPGVPVDADRELAEELKAVEQRRRELEALISRARRLCLKHQVRDSFSSLLRINLGRYAPQERADPAIGRSERNAAMASLVELKIASQEWSSPSAQANADRDADPPNAKNSLLKRLVDFFY